MVINDLLISQSESPSQSDLNALGIYLLCSLSFVFGALVEFAVVIVINQMAKQKDGISGNKLDAPQAQPWKHFHNGLRSRMTQFRLRKKIMQKRCIDSEFKKETTTMQQSNNTWESILPESKKIDFAAFWLYLFLYFSFNIAYWVRYSTNL